MTIPTSTSPRGATETVRQHALDHQVVTIPTSGLASHFVRSIWHCEMPVVNGHGAAKLLLSGLASKQVKSVLTGEGADELLAGYDLFRHQAMIERVRREPRQSVPFVLRCANSWVPWTCCRAPSRPGTTRSMTEWSSFLGPTLIPALRALKLGSWIRRLLSREFIRGIGDFDPLEQLAAGGAPAPWQTMTP